MTAQEMLEEIERKIEESTDIRELQRLNVDWAIQFHKINGDCPLKVTQSDTK